MSSRWFIPGIFALLTLSLLVGCRNRSAPAPTPAPQQEPMMGRQQVDPSQYAANGEQIYHTATSKNGDAITFTGGPRWLSTSGGSCVSCHGADGRGGFAIAMTNETAPDIRYSALTAVTPGQKTYTTALIERAITKGLDEDGEPLSSTMPRWQMSDRDLKDLIDYLKKL